MIKEECTLCGEERTPWYHISRDICQSCYYLKKSKMKKEIDSLDIRIKLLGDLISSYRTSFKTLLAVFFLNFIIITWDSALVYFVKEPYVLLDGISIGACGATCLWIIMILWCNRRD